MNDMVLVPRGALNAMLGYIEVASHAIELGHVGAKCFGDLKAALSAAPPASVGREEIARIVSPEAFEPLPHGNIVRGREAVALAKADAILSALGRTEAPTPPEGEGLTPGD